MKKSSKILLSRYPSSEGILASPKELNNAYKKIYKSKKWALIGAEKGHIGNLKCSIEYYADNSSFARIIIPDNIEDIVSIELGTRFTKSLLKNLAKTLKLPYYEKEVRYE